MVTAICCFNSIEQFEVMKASLCSQSVVPEIVAIDNRSGEYKNAANALNEGALMARHNVLVFLHQDIVITNPFFIELIEKQVLEETRIGDIIGVAGAKAPLRSNLSNILHGATEVCHAGTRIDKLTECDTVDECFIVMRKETWEKYRFNSKNCPGWHLYAVDESLATRKDGNQVFVTQIDGIIHKSTGVVSYEYYRNLIQLAKYYARDFKTVWTTCGKVKTNALFRFYFLNRKKIGKLLKRV